MPILNTTNYPAGSLEHLVGLDASQNVTTQPLVVQKIRNVALSATFPVAMSSPPTVSAISTTSAVTGSVVGAIVSTLPNTDVYRFITGNPVQAGPFYPKDSFVNWQTQTDGFLSVISATTAAVEFVTDAPTFELLWYGGGSDHRIFVDGQFVSTSFVNVPPDGNIYYQKLAFGSRATRRIRCVGTGGLAFGGVKVTALDTVWRPAIAVPLRMICVGDSYTEGNGATNPATSLVPVIGGYLGVEDIWASALGGTGYLQTNSGRVKFRDRLAADVTAYSPDIILTMGGLNDGSFSGAAITAEVTAYHAAIRAALPSVLNIVLGPWNPHDATTATTKSAITAGVTAGDAQAIFIDNNTLPWQSPANGTVTSPAGNGNGDVYLSTDNSHPTQEGHEYLGRRVADEIKRAIAVL